MEKKKFFKVNRMKKNQVANKKRNAYIIEYRGFQWNLVLYSFHESEKQLFILKIIMTAVLSNRGTSSLWARFCEWITSTENRLYIGWFGVLMIPCLLTATSVFIIGFIAAPPVDITQFRTKIWKHQCPSPLLKGVCFTLGELLEFKIRKRTSSLYITKTSKHKQ